MVQELLPLLPQEAGRLALVVAIVGTAVGCALWLAGARFSKPLVTLLAVTVGGIVGKLLPGWTGWTVTPAATTVGGAFLFGLSGYLLHRVWVGLLLGMVLACWASLGTWVVCHNGDWTWPAVDASTTWQGFAQASWANLPEDVRKFLPVSAGVALVTGFASTLLWPRFGQVLLYSTAGASLLLGMGIAAIEFGKPEWITIVPAQTSAQLVTLLAVVAFGAVVQWQLSPAAPKPAGGGGGGGDGAPKNDKK